MGVGLLFGVAGLGAAQGVATAVVYGVIVLVASLPGAGVLVTAWLRENAGRASQPVDSPRWRLSATVSPEGAARG